MVEQLTLNQLVLGSNPSRGTTFHLSVVHRSAVIVHGSDLNNMVFLLLGAPSFI